MKNRIFLGGLILIIFGIITTGCSSTVNWTRVELNVDRPPRSQIHNLRHETVGLEREFQRKVEDIMKDFFDSRGEEFGYYTVQFTYQPAGLADIGILWIGLNAITLSIGSLLGMPYTATNYRLHAYLRIFDSAGDLVQTFQSSGRMTVNHAFYYDSPTVTIGAGKVYSELLDDLLRQADRDTRKVNEMLEAVGPITVQNTAAARSKIRASERN
jgi:hypothetical protein